MMTTDSGDRAPDDELLVRFLLGALDEKEAEPLEERSIADEEFAWGLRAVENDLIDSYARGQLSGLRREQFEAVYLGSPQRRERVAFARALVALQEQRRAGGIGSAVGRRPLVPRYLYAAAALALALTASYLILNRRGLEREPTAPTVRLEPSSPSTPPGTVPRTPTPSSPDRGTAAASVSRTVFSFNVPAIATRGAGDTPLMIPAGTTHVELSLEANTPAPTVGHVVVRTVSGRTVWEGSGGRAGSGLLTRITIPADLLRPDDYLAIVSTPAPEIKELWRYSFRVAAPRR